VTAASVRNPRYVVVLAILSVAILAIGMAVRRAIETGTPEPPAPSESDLLRLARSSQRRSLEDMAGYLRSIAEQTQRSIVWLPELGATSVAWAGGLIVTAGSNDPIEHAEESGPQMPLAALRRAEAGAQAALLRPNPMARPGDWIVVVWRNGAQHAYEAGNVAGTATADSGNDRSDTW
jgi:hypothetical protein